MLAIIQARMTSSRLPGKVLKTLHGRPMLAWTVARLRKSRRVTRILIATSDQPSDDPIMDFCMLEGVACWRGSLDDVASRFLNAAQAEQAAVFVRVNGDSPLIDPSLVDQSIKFFEQKHVDLVTNVLIRSFPKGQSVEVINTQIFSKIYAEITETEDFEHVTRAFYKFPDRYRIFNFKSGVEAGDIQLAVDTYDDFLAIEHIISVSSGRPGGWRELIALYPGQPS
jgi:spore coat polysaccharide biosynthesis protein SpsF